MNKEIKEKQLKEVLYGLDYIGNKIKNDDGKLELGVNNCKILLDYITNLQEDLKYQEEMEEEYYKKHTKLMQAYSELQEENKRLKENMNCKECCFIKDNVNYIRKIDKTLNYIDKNLICDTEQPHRKAIIIPNELENILKGEDDEKE